MPLANTATLSPPATLSGYVVNNGQPGNVRLISLNGVPLGEGTIVQRINSDTPRVNYIMQLAGIAPPRLNGDTLILSIIAEDSGREYRGASYADGTDAYLSLV